MNDLAVFKFRESFPVRVSDRNGSPWFVAADVCKALAISNPRMAVARLDEDEISSVSFSDGGLRRKINIISESGLYALVIRSNKPEAREFRKWITSEVLPAIRQKGFYSMNVDQALSDPEEDSAKRSTAELIEQINRRLVAGEHIQPHVLQYVSNIARIASGVWYRDCFGIDGRARKIIIDGSAPLLPDFTPEEDCAARRILKIVRKYGKCTLRNISVNMSKGWTADDRMRLITDMVAAGILHAEGVPGDRGTIFRT